MAQTNASERRVFERTSVNWGATLMTSDVAQACEVTDFSLGGAKIATTGPFSLRDPVSLDVTGVGKFKGTVAWRDGNVVGVNFSIAPQQNEIELDVPNHYAALSGLDPF